MKLNSFCNHTEQSLFSLTLVTQMEWMGWDELELELESMGFTWSEITRVQTWQHGVIFVHFVKHHRRLHGCRGHIWSVIVSVQECDNHHDSLEEGVSDSGLHSVKCHLGCTTRMLP